jgi:hypothetical protein
VTEVDSTPVKPPEKCSKACRSPARLAVPAAVTIMPSPKDVFSGH